MTAPTRSDAARRTPHPEPGEERLALEARIRDRVLGALARARTPGYHFPGHLLRLESLRFGRDGVLFSMPAGPHCEDPDGNVDLHAVTLLGDMALASSNRIYVPPASRTATLELSITFTGAPARGTLRCEAWSEGFSPYAKLRQASCRGRIDAGDQVVAHLAGTWVAPPVPKGVVLSPLPWEQGGAIPADVMLSEPDLDAGERKVYRRAQASIVASRDGGGFLHHFWSQEAHATGTGSRGRFEIGMHTGNRVGHVQGGLLMGFAARVAIAAVPHHRLLTSVSAWFISPGEGRALTAQSQILQQGRNVAVVRTQVFGAGRKRVLETISTHAVRSHG